MIATVEQKDLLAGLQAAGRAVSGRSTLPILNNVLVEGEEGRLRFVATDLELHIEAEVAAEVKEPGAMTIPARVGAELAQRFPVGVPITMSDNEAHTVEFVANKDTRYHVRGLPSEEFSTLPEIEGGETLTVPIPDLLAAVRRVAFACSGDETRPMLTGVLCEVGGGKLTLSATDTHRLAQAQVEVRKQKELQCIIPARALCEVARLWAKGEGMGKVALSERLCEFRAEGLPVVASRLVPGEFPNYKRVIPTDFDRKLTVAADDVPQLREALGRILVVGSEDANRIVLTVGAEGLALEADSQDIGSGLDKCVPCTVEGPLLEIAFNGRYLSDAVQVTEGDVSLSMSGPLSPGTLHDSADPSWLYVLMPMQIM